MSATGDGNQIVEHKVEDVINDLTHATSITFDPKTKAGKKFKDFVVSDLYRWLGRNIRYIFVSFLVLFVSIFSFNEITKLHSVIEDIEIQKNEHKQTIDELNKLVDNKNNELEILESKLTGSSFVIINKQTFLSDMKNRFPKISPDIAELIVNTVLSESKKYNMSPIILYSMGIVESSHRYWIEHAQVTLNIYDDKTKKKRKVITKAVGWGGVVWEWHDKMLKANGIAQERNELFYPETNIKATAAIYDKFFHMTLKKGVTNPDVSAQRRYFGGNYKAYSDKINAQVVRFVNEEIYRKSVEKNVK